MSQILIQPPSRKVNFCERKPQYKKIRLIIIPAIYLREFRTVFRFIYLFFSYAEGLASSKRSHRGAAVGAVPLTFIRMWCGITRRPLLLLTWRRHVLASICCYLFSLASRQRNERCNYGTLIQMIRPFGVRAKEKIFHRLVFFSAPLFSHLFSFFFNDGKMFLEKYVGVASLRCRNSFTFS